MLNKLRVRVQEEKGFTLVELLVVMLILGLLAAIAIPSFFNQRDKARDADAKSSVRTAQTAMETYNTDNQGSYAGASATDLTSIESTLNDAPGTLSVTSDATSYSVQVDSPTGNSFRITRESNGQTSLTCGATAAIGSPLGAPGEDGCPDSGTWG